MKGLRVSAGLGFGEFRVFGSMGMGFGDFMVGPGDRLGSLGLVWRFGLMGYVRWWVLEVV